MAGLFGKQVTGMLRGSGLRTSSASPCTTLQMLCSKQPVQMQRSAPALNQAKDDGYCLQVQVLAADACNLRGQEAVLSGGEGIRAKGLACWCTE